MAYWPDHNIPMRTITRRLSSLISLVRPLALTFLGVLFLSLGGAYLLFWFYRDKTPGAIINLLTLEFLPIAWRGPILILIGLAVLALGIWQLSGVAVIPLNEQQPGELVLGYQRESRPSRITVLSGGAGMLMLAEIGTQVERLTCITPVQDPVEYYYRAAGLYNFQNVYYVVPTPTPIQVVAELDTGVHLNIMEVGLSGEFAAHHVRSIRLAPPADGSSPNPASLPLTRLARETLRDTDAIILGPGSLFESILPNLLLDEFRATLQQSNACKIYVCNLMTEPGLTTGFNVGEHIRQIKRYGGFTPDYVLVNAQRIDSSIQHLYAAAHQAPVYLDPEEYEETVAIADQRDARRQVIIEGSVVIEGDLASSVVQYSTSLDNPGERNAVRVLRHDQQKLGAAILELLKRRT